MYLRSISGTFVLRAHTGTRALELACQISQKLAVACIVAYTFEAFSMHDFLFKLTPPRHTNFFCPLSLRDPLFLFRW